jgi:CRP-like cAMP-binding protein
VKVPPLQLTQNLLIRAMPPESQKRLAAAARVCEVQIGQRTFNEDEPTDAWFPLDAVVSLMRTLENGDMVEVGMVGSEGLIGINAVLGVPLNPHAGVTQGRGMIATVPSEALREELTREPRVADVLHRFVYSFYAGVSQLVACNRRHTVVQRLAQWLLMLQDRTGADELSLTHEFLSFMLATRRPGISEAMAALTDAGAIVPKRNRARVVDRAKLETISCECYRISFDEYERTLGFAPVTRERRSPID